MLKTDLFLVWISLILNTEVALLLVLSTKEFFIYGSKTDVYISGCLKKEGEEDTYIFMEAYKLKAIFPGTGCSASTSAEPPTS